jgi:tetratricopeptide (TPR) repeat protein
LEGETGGDPLPLIDLAERAMVLAAREAPGTAAAYAARRDLGALYLRMERWNDARDVLDPLLADQSVPTVAPFVALAAHLGTARASARLGQLEDALTHYDSALVYEPEPLARGVLLREAAEMCRETGDDAHAADYYAKALPLLEPDLATYVDVLVALAYTRLRLRRFGEAIDTFGEALDIAEKSARTDSALMASVLFDMAAAHDSLGQYRAAAETYRRSLAFQDRNRAERYRGAKPMPNPTSPPWKRITTRSNPTF